MPKTHGRGRVFAHRLDYPSRLFPLVDVGSTQETSYPYRSARSLVLRAPLTRCAVVVGLWGAPRDEEDALRDAIGGRDLGRYSEWGG